ncbi:MAG: hypothetical protein RSB66_06675 [Clostridium sp.]
MDNYREKFEGYFIEYFGDIRSALSKIDYAVLYEALPIYYLVLVECGRLKDFLRDLPDIITIQQNYVYVLSQIEERDYAIEDKYVNLSSNYTGSGVTLGIIGGGVDYLDFNFMYDDENTRIKAIWDQTIDGNSGGIVSYGKEYKKVDIEEAMKLGWQGKNHNKIVEHTDSNGYGTNICKAISGSKFNSVNQCEYAIVKLKKAELVTRKMNCIKFKNGNLYETYDIIKALEYLYKLNKVTLEPMVVYLPLESNFGGRDGGEVLERVIDYFSNMSKDLFIVTNNGNEGDGYRHSDGIIDEKDDELYVPIIVGAEAGANKEERKFDFIVSIWTNKYDKLSIKVISPLEEETIPIDSCNRFEINTTKFEAGTIETLSIEPRVNSNEEETIIKVRDAVQGTWIINLVGKEIIYGDYDIWLPMKELTNYSIVFKYPSKNRTLTTPSTAKTVLSSMCYSRYEKGIRVLSGMPSGELKKRTRASLVVDGTGILIEDEHGIVKIDGIAASGCILTWFTIVILQWAIVEGNKPDVNLSDIRIILARSSIKYSNLKYSIVDINKLNQLLV